MFIDVAEIFLKAGDGGNGIVSFHRAKYITSGGPDGGDGGDGGSIVFEVDLGLRTLVDFRYKRKYEAEPGNKGANQNSSGRGAKDLVIRVPCGTIVKDKDTGMIMADLSHEGQREVICRGGKGGWGNQHFATPTRQIPTFARDGTPGQERTVILELKLLADVGLLGFPNVGKSTLLSMVSAAKPKIANYHFTTITPNLGVVSVGPNQSFIMADIPGLIEGANEGVGLGHNFLRHVERTKLLVHIVDIAELDGRDAVSDFDVINRELELYNPDVAKRPQIVVANKIDILPDSEKLDAFKATMKSRGYDVFAISAATNQGVTELMRHVYETVKDLPDIVPDQIVDMALVEAAQKEAAPYKVRNENGVYVVEGPWVDRVMGSVNIDDRDSLQYFQRVMKNMGVIEALEAKGIKEGNTVRIGALEFDFIY